VNRYGNWTSYFVKENAIVPDSFKTAEQSNEWPAWRKAIFCEFDSIIENGVFEIVQVD